MYTKKSIDKLIKKIEYCIQEDIKYSISNNKLSIIMHPISIGDYSELRCQDTKFLKCLTRLEYKFA
jgi:hypothetical protein